MAWQDKEYWDGERQRRKIDRALTGRKTPPAKTIIGSLMPDKPNGKEKKDMEKKKKKVNGYKDKPNRRCYYTGAPYAERHELFGGPNRQTSIDHGFQVDLCWPIHKLFHGIVDKTGLESFGLDIQEPLKWAEKQLEILRKDCQQNYELREQVELGLTQNQARQSWMKLIGRNYLD